MKVSEFLMPYVLSRLIYNVSGKGEMRVEAQRQELGAQPPAIFDSEGNQGPRGEAQSPVTPDVRDHGDFRCPTLPQPIGGETKSGPYPPHARLF